MSKRKFEVVSTDNRKYDGRKKIKLPQRKTHSSAGYDFVSPVACTIPPNKEVTIYTEVKAYMNDDEWLGLYIRSSLGLKGLQLKNIVGIIDADYTDNPDNEGNIIACLKNTSNKTIRIKEGERFMQGIFQKFLVTDDDDKHEKLERSGGHGSTGDVDEEDDE